MAENGMEIPYRPQFPTSASFIVATILAQSLLKAEILCELSHVSCLGACGCALGHARRIAPIGDLNATVTCVLRMSLSFTTRQLE